MQTTTPADTPLNESADLPPSSNTQSQAASQPDSSIILAATLQQHFPALLALLKEQYAVKKAAAQAEAKAATYETYGAMLYSVVMVLICIGAVLYLSAHQVLSGVSAGTLVGTIVGYALSHLRPAAVD